MIIEPMSPEEISVILAQNNYTDEVHAELELIAAQAQRNAVKQVLDRLSIRDAGSEYPEWAISDEEYKELKSYSGVKRGSNMDKVLCGHCSGLTNKPVWAKMFSHIVSWHTVDKKGNLLPADESKVWYIVYYYECANCKHRYAVTVDVEEIL